MAKVKMKYDPANEVYVVKSKSLTAVLSRAMLIVQALGEDRVEDFRVYPPTAVHKKYAIFVYPRVSTTR